MNYTDALIAITQSRVKSAVHWRSLGVVEAGIGLLARAFLNAESNHKFVTPGLMACLIRELLTEGNAYSYLETGIGRSPRLVPATSGYVIGDYREWWYRLNLGGPSQTTTVFSHQDGVIHVAFAPTPGEPWRGRAPLDIAQDTSTLAEAIERDLHYETQVPIGRLIPVPEGTDHEKVIVPLKADLEQLKGGVAFPETTQAGYGTGPAAAPRADWQPHKLGPEYDRGVIEARQQTNAIVLMGLGIPPSLILGGVKEAAAREDWRRCFHGTILPLAGMFVYELSRKLETEVTFDFSKLAAADLASRARAFQSMVASGMDISKAATLSGLVLQEEESEE